MVHKKRFIVMVLMVALDVAIDVPHTRVLGVLNRMSNTTSIPQMSGYLSPYKGERYHLPDFRRGSSPKGKKEIFNHRHSSLRCTIEITYVVLKNRWRMLREMHSFPLEKQVKIVIASIALHNFIRINARMDMEFKHYDDDQGLLPLNEEESRVDSLVEEDASHHTREMEEQRDRIANLLISH
uniref:DDE Tnp4 domain-containing protein n=1 Tax=Vitis vinifera TaxID=29760 RepID=A5ACR4_VITVI|nr:hypothetical protein VITISV_005893 [Vitis vinifera]